MEKDASVIDLSPVTVSTPLGDSIYLNDPSTIERDFTGMGLIFDTLLLENEFCFLVRPFGWCVPGELERWFTGIETFQETLILCGRGFFKVSKTFSR